MMAHQCPAKTPVTGEMDMVTFDVTERLCGLMGVNHQEFLATDSSRMLARKTERHLGCS